LGARECRGTVRAFDPEQNLGRRGGTGHIISLLVWGEVVLGELTLKRTQGGGTETGGEKRKKDGERGDGLGDAGGKGVETSLSQLGSLARADLLRQQRKKKKKKTHHRVGGFWPARSEETKRRGVHATRKEGDGPRNSPARGPGSLNRIASERGKTKNSSLTEIGGREW